MVNPKEPVGGYEAYYKRDKRISAGAVCMLVVLFGIFVAMALSGPVVSGEYHSQEGSWAIQNANSVNQTPFNFEYALTQSGYIAGLFGAMIGALATLAAVLIYPKMTEHFGV